MTSNYLNQRVAISFIRGSLSHVVDLVGELLTSSGIVPNVRSVDECVFPVELTRRLPGRNGAPAAALFESFGCPTWTALLNSSEDGWPSLIGGLGKARAEILHAAFDILEPVYPSTVFEFFCNGKSVRRLHAWRDDDGWHFLNRGDSMPFENQANYRRKAIANRLNRAIVEELLLGFKVDIRRTLSEPVCRSTLILT